jgi:hypothetical protein
MGASKSPALNQGGVFERLPWGLRIENRTKMSDLFQTNPLLDLKATLLSPGMK